MAETKVQSNQVSFNTTTDANGWTVYDFGSFKEFRKQVSGTANYAAGAAFISELNTSLPVGYTGTQVAFHSITLGNNGTSNLRLNVESLNPTNLTNSGLIVRSNGSATTGSNVMAIYVLRTV